MSEFNFDEPESSSKSSGGRGFALGVWDILSIVVLLITICMGIYFLMIYSNPDSAFNLLPPRQPSVLVSTHTPTPIQLDATWTPTPTVYFSPTATLLPSITPPATGTLANLTPVANTPEPTKTPTPTQTPKAPFSVSAINSIESIIIPHLLEVGCNWQGVGGTVDDQNNSPIIGIVVRLAGMYDGKTIELTTVSGISPEYGKSGFEFVLGDTPINSREKIYVQLLDQAGLPLSEEIYIDTSSDCKENLVLVRFKKNR